VDLRLGYKREDMKGWLPYLRDMTFTMTFTSSPSHSVGKPAKVKIPIRYKTQLATWLSLVCKFTTASSRKACESQWKSSFYGLRSYKNNRKQKVVFWLF